jgi:hypothetical protein
MNIRELLQTEIWSKETSRKILGWIGIVLGCFATLVAVEYFWLTPGERLLGRAALAQIDGLQALDPESDAFDAGAKQADGMLKAATLGAWTVRDKRVASALGAYLMIFEMEPEGIKMRRMIQQRHIHQSPEELESQRQTELLGIRARQFLSARLHSVLD